MRFTKTLIAGLAMAITAGAASGAFAETRWDQHHPRRTEVNERLAHQHHRIIEARRHGHITRHQAHELRVEDRGIRAQERFDASRHHGHITPIEQRRLNHEENRVSHQIRHG